MTNNLVATVSVSLEDEIKVAQHNDTTYEYSFYSKGQQEFSKHVDDFEYIENSIIRQYGAFGQTIVNRLKRQLQLV